jgi:predicted GNAT family acetyltransferase
MGEVIGLICTPETFRSVDHEAVRWLDPNKDLTLWQQTAIEMGAEAPSQEDLDEWHQQGYRYCALVQGELMIAKAAVWTYSDTAWELAAVSTLPDQRGRGYAKAVCSFATAHILGAGRTATCHTARTNAAMIRVAESLGYRRG